MIKAILNIQSCCCPGAMEARGLVDWMKKYLSVWAGLLEQNAYWFGWEAAEQKSHCPEVARVFWSSGYFSTVIPCQHALRISRLLQRTLALVLLKSIFAGSWSALKPKWSRFSLPSFVQTPRNHSFVSQRSQIRHAILRWWHLLHTPWTPKSKSDGACWDQNFSHKSFSWNEVQ